MKTLDEVIKAVDEKLGVGGEEAIESSLETDALHYLKEYQAILPLVPSLINTAIAVQKKGKTIG